MMKRRELVEGFIGDAFVLQHARAALHVFALAVISVVFLTAAARHALTSQGMPKLESLE